MFPSKAILAVAVWLGLASAALAQSEVGHYQPGVVNSKDFVVPEAGWYYCQYDTHYHSTRFNDEHGKKTDLVTIGGTPVTVRTEIDWVAVSPTLVWAAPGEVLGGTFGAFVSVPLQNNAVAAELMGRRFGISAEESTYGLGDIQVQPVWLGWSGSFYDLSAAYGFFAPSGAYKLGSSDNVGTGFWSNYLQGAAAIYFTEDQSLGFYFTATYEINTRNEGEHITGGDHLCLEYSLSKSFGERVEVALSGTNIWQTTRDHGSDVTWDRGILDQAHALGGQLAFWLIPGMAQISFNAMWEYDTRDRYQGYFGMINLMIAFGEAPAAPAAPAHPPHGHHPP